MRSDLRRPVILERAIARENELGEAVVTWVPSRTLTVTLAPAGQNVLTRAALVGQKVTHVAVLPAGVRITPLTHRLLVGNTAHTISTVTTTPRGVVVELDAQQSPGPILDFAHAGNGQYVVLV